MAELTPRDDIKKRVSENLKRVDHLIRVGEIDQAMREIIQAKEIDPKNVYIFAYEERLAYLKEEHERHKEEEKTRRQAEEAARKRDEELRKKENDALKATREQARAKEQKQQSRDEVQEKWNAEKAELRLLEQKRKSRETASHTDALAKYKTELMKAWQDGATTPLEEDALKEFRWNLSVSLEEHLRLTKEAQRECYLKAFKAAWSSGSITPERANELADLRKRFNISPEEFDSVEAEILWQIRTALQTPQVVLIDDDVQLLDAVADTLQEAGYIVKSFTTSDDAFRYLKEQIPDMIVADINLETSTMGGFTFYEKVREIEQLHDVPFIFLSGLTDEVLIRTGKELGVDDYLTKPFSKETLLATIKGKLKRFKQLRDSHNKKKG